MVNQHLQTPGQTNNAFHVHDVAIIQGFSRLASRIHGKVSSIPTRSSADLLVADVSNTLLSPCPEEDYNTVVETSACPEEDYNTVVETSATKDLLNFGLELKKLHDESRCSILTGRLYSRIIYEIVGATLYS